MPAGMFRELAEFERMLTGPRDKYGNPSDPQWEQLVTVRANLRETTGRERLAAGRLEAPATGTLRVRASSATRAITAADRVTVRGHLWSIVSPPVDPEGRGRLLEFTLERGGAEQ